jgi:hypothetical protein
MTAVLRQLAEEDWTIAPAALAALSPYITEPASAPVVVRGERPAATSGDVCSSPKSSTELTPRAVNAHVRARCSKGARISL